MIDCFKNFYINLCFREKKKVNRITSQGSGFSFMNPILVPPAPPGGGIFYNNFFTLSLIFSGISLDFLKILRVAEDGLC